MSVPDSLRAAELAPLWEAAHHRLSAGRPVTRLRLGPLSAGERSALADLLGEARLPGERPTVAFAKLDSVLAEAGTSTTAVVSELVGPIGDRAAAATHAASEREALWSWLAGHEVVTTQPVLAEWVAQVRRTGLLGGSIPATRRLLEQALSVLARLPAEGQPLPNLAAEVTGDAHALDDGTRLAGLVLRALATIFGVDTATGAAGRRAVWERAGLADDQLSATVLTAGLRPGGHGTAVRVAALCAEAGHAAALTLAQLRGSTITDAPSRAWVVENPSVLAMALGRFGAACPPLVCTSGWPNSATTLLLRTLAAAGTHLRYHGDFDGEGLRIAAYLLEKTGAGPWRMSAADYRAAIGHLPGAAPEPGRITEAPWDAELAGALREHAVAVVEERLAEDLLGDLEAAAGDGRAGG